MNFRHTVRAALLTVALTGLAGSFTSCVSLDSFFFSPLRTEAYDFADEVKPTDTPEQAAARMARDYWPDEPQVPQDLREEVTLRDASGAVIGYGIFLRRPASERATAPTVIYNHGNAQHIDYYWNRVNHLWNLGANVIIYDYPGYGRSPGSPTEAGIYATARAAREFIRSLGTEIDQTRLFIYGYSLGGAPATELASTEGCRGLILEATFTSVSGLAADGSLLVPRSFVMTNTFDNRGKIRDAARLASRGAPAGRVVVLIFHGEEDDFVQTKYGEQLAETVREEPAAGNVRLELIPSAGHGDVPKFGDAENQRYSTRLVDFWNQP